MAVSSVGLKSGRWVMYAHRGVTSGGEPHFTHIQPSLLLLSMHGDYDPVVVLVEIHADQTPETRSSGFGVDYWGWIPSDDSKPHHVYPSYPQMAMCFTGSVARMEGLGRGKAYRLSVTEVSGSKKG